MSALAASPRALRRHSARLFTPSHSISCVTGGGVQYGKGMSPPENRQSPPPPLASISDELDE